MSAPGPIRLPDGVRDFLPGQASALDDARTGLLATLEGRGYRRVITPSIEYLDVLLRGTDLHEDRILKLVEPDTGRVMALRPDITPQVARLVATALRDEPPPLRLSYSGAVHRLEHRHSGARREVWQVGAECLGVPGVEGDAEVVSLLAELLAGMGFAAFTLDVGHTGLLRAVLSRAFPAPAARAAFEDALRRKDGGAVRAGAASVADPALRAICEALPGLYGDLSVVERARALVPPEVAGDALDDLLALGAALTERGFADRLSIDLGEVRGLGYHSGIVFQAFVAGPGRPVGGGGRYDGLTGRYGRPMPATGFALDLGAALEALDRCRRS